MHQSLLALLLKGKGVIMSILYMGVKRKGIRVLPRFTAQGEKGTKGESGPPEPCANPGRVFLAQRGGRRGHLMTGCGPKQPTSPRKLMAVQASRKGQQKDTSPFWCEVKWKIYSKINERAQQGRLGALSADGGKSGCAVPLEKEAVAWGCALAWGASEHFPYGGLLKK